MFKYFAFPQILLINPKYIINDHINNAFLILRYEIKSPLVFLLDGPLREIFLSIESYHKTRRKDQEDEISDFLFRKCKVFKVFIDPSFPFTKKKKKKVIAR